jgi:phospholipid/cholesterol/gamma-HCH transport system substrate-binding protein
LNSKFSYMLLGLFVLGLGAALIASILWLSTGGLTRPDYDYYLVYTQESVTGLSVDSRVTYKGVEVGKVADISLSPRHPEVVRLLLKIRKGTPIKTDTVAMLQMQGLTGLSTIDLSGGSAKSPLLEAAPGQPYPVIESEPSLFGRLEDVVKQLVGRVSLIADRLNEILSPENQRRLSGTLENMEKISGEVAGHSDELGKALEDLSATLKDVRTAGRGLPELIAQFRSTASTIEATAREIERAGTTVRKQAVAGGERLARLESSTLPDARATLDALREAADNLRRMSEKLQRDPSILMYGAPPPRRGPGE